MGNFVLFYVGEKLLEIESTHDIVLMARTKGRKVYHGDGGGVEHW